MVQCVQPAHGSLLPLKVRRKVIRRTVEGLAGERGRRPGEVIVAGGHFPVPRRGPRRLRNPWGRVPAP